MHIWRKWLWLAYCKVTKHKPSRLCFHKPNLFERIYLQYLYDESARAIHRMREAETIYWQRVREVKAKAEAHTYDSRHPLDDQPCDNCDNEC